MTEHTGWLLDLYEDPLGGLVLWFLDDAGARRRLRQRFPVTFYVSGPAGLLHALGAWLERQSPARPARSRAEERVDVFAGKKVPVLAVEVQRPADLNEVYRQASRAFPDLTFSDADLQITLRYAAATGVAPLGRCRVILGADDFVQSITALDSPWDLDPRDPPLRVLSLQPDRDPAHSTPRAVLVQAGGRSYSLALAKARPLLVNLRALLAEYDPDLLLTAWGDTWLLPRLLDAGEEHHLPLPLNRDPDAAIPAQQGAQVFLLWADHLPRRAGLPVWALAYRPPQRHDVAGLRPGRRCWRWRGSPACRCRRPRASRPARAFHPCRSDRAAPGYPGALAQAAGREPQDRAWTCSLLTRAGWSTSRSVGCTATWREIDFISMYPAIMVRCNISPETIDARRDRG